jgi:membrane-associated phospholipid phosphatase
MTSILVWGLVVTLAWPWLRGRRQRAAAVIAAAAAAVLVGATRVYLGTDYPTDVVAGWALGGLLLALTATGLSLWRSRFMAVPQRQEPEEFGAEQVVT